MSSFEVAVFFPNFLYSQQTSHMTGGGDNI